MLSVARALARRGHDVTMVTGVEHVADAARAGVSFVELPHTPGSSLDDLTPYRDSLEMARAMTPLVAGVAPDVAVIDLLTLGAALACEVNDVPHATLSIHPLHSPSRELPPFGWGKPPGRGLWRVRDAWMRRSNVGDLRRARDALNGIRATLGLDGVERLDAQMSQRLILVATLPALEIARSDWPAHAQVIGPCLWDGQGDMPPIPDGDGPLVAIALSTAHAHADLSGMAVGAVVRAGARAVLTLGKTSPPPRLPASVCAVAYAAHDALLPLCDAVVCTGGHGIVARALTHGVPLVVVPGHGDQRENGYRVERAGAGRRVLKPSTRRIARALDQVLRDPAFAARARGIADEACSLDGPGRAAELLEALARDAAARP
jgi:UDP:flavonoid glycosyltransferase YjiC (YdhE family)